MSKNNIQKDFLQNILKKLLDKNLTSLEQKAKTHINILTSSKELTKKMTNTLSYLQKHMNKKYSLKRKSFCEKDFGNTYNKDAYPLHNRSKIKSNLLNNFNKNNLNKKNPINNNDLLKNKLKNNSKIKHHSKSKKVNCYKNIQNNYLINLYGDNINIISNEDKINYNNIFNRPKLSLKKNNTMFNLYKRGTKNKKYNDNSLFQNQSLKYKSNNSSIVDPNEIIPKSIRKKSLPHLRKNAFNALFKKDKKITKIIRKKTPCKTKNEKNKGELKLKTYKERTNQLNNNLLNKIAYDTENIKKKENTIINDITLINSSVNKVDSMIMNYNLLSLENEDFEDDLEILNKNLFLNKTIKKEEILNNINNQNYAHMNNSFHLEDFDNEYYNYILDYLEMKDLINVKNVSKFYNNVVVRYFIEKLEKKINKFIKKKSSLELISNADKTNKNISFDSFNLSKTSEKAINLLNEQLLSKLFYSYEVPSDDVLLIYKIFFNMINHPIKDINYKEKEKFWDKCRNYFIIEGKGKIGDFIFDLIKDKKICLNGKNLYDIYTLIENKADKIIPSYFSKICGTTGLFSFFIKDILDFIGITNGKIQSQNSFAIYNIIIDFLNEKIKKLKKDGNNDL